MTCDECGLRTHIKWCNVSPVEYVNFQNSNDHTWLCSNREEYVLNVSDTRNDTRMITEENYMKDLADKVQSCASKEIKVTHLNVRSLRNKIDEIRCLQVFCRFDIIAITESHLDNSITNSQLEIEGMKFARLGRNGRRGRGLRVCILYHAEYFKAVHRRDLHTPCIEALWL